MDKVLGEVVLMSFGEPQQYNVIDMNEDTREIKCQVEGHGGSFWTPIDKCMSLAAIEWYYISKAASEIQRLEIKLRKLKEQQRTPDQ